MARIGEAEVDKRFSFWGVVNFGGRPTLGLSSLRAEAISFFRTASCVVRVFRLLFGNGGLRLSLVIGPRFARTR
jgi:hypothetical protein